MSRRSSRSPAWKVVAVAGVLAVLAGAAVMLQVRGWSVLEREPVSACGRGSGACPRGVVPALIASFVTGLAAISFLIGALVRRPRITTGVAIGLAAGVFGAQALSGWLHGTALRTDWTASYDGPGRPATEGVWATGGSLIRVRGDEIVSYQAGTATTGPFGKIQAESPPSTGMTAPVRALASGEQSQAIAAATSSGSRRRRSIAWVANASWDGRS